MTLGEKVRELRTGLGLTQADLAERLGNTQGMIAAIEGGRKTIGTPVLMFAICDVFGITPQDLRPFIEAFPENPPPAKAKKRKA